MLLKLPTLLTSARGLAGPVVAWMMLARLDHMAAFWLFIGAAFTDLFDGWLARKVGSDPEWGAMLDPLADKSLAGCSWLALGCVGWAPWWLAGTHILRDLVVGTMWFRRRSRGEVEQPTRFGQLMTSYEGTAIGILLFHGPYCGVHWPSVGVAIGICSLVLSLASALAYLGPRRPLPA